MRVIAGLFVVLAVSLMSFEARADDHETQAPSMAASGLIMFVGSYAASAAMALSYRDTDGRVATKMTVPVVGPWITLKDERFDTATSLTGRLITATRADHCADASVCGGELLLVPVAIVEYAFLLIDPIAQATGVVMAFVGAAKSDAENPHERPSEPEPPKVSVRPALVGTGPGMSLSITRW